MNIKHWLQNIFGNSTIAITPKSPAQGADLQKAPKALLDLAQEALRQEAAHLQGLVEHGVVSMREKQLKKKVRAKVAAVIDPAYGDSKIVDEVTERIVLAAVSDPHYQELFDDNSQANLTETHLKI